MKRLLLAAGGAYALAGVPLSPAEAPADAQAVCGTVYCAVVNTAKKVHENNCTPSEANNQCAFDPLKSAIKTAWESTATAVCPTSIAACSILKMAAHWAIPMPYSISTPGGDFAGGGADGGWQPDDCAVEIGIDADGKLIVPSIPLSTGGPMTLGTPVFFEGITGYNTIVATSRQAVSLWYFHAVINVQRSSLSSDNRVLVGCYRWTGSRADCASVGFWDGVTKRSSHTSQITPDPGGTWQSAYDDKNCPIGTTTGGDFHFYFLRTGKSCVQYAPNDAVGKMGYRYGHRSTVPWGSNLNVMLQGNPWLKCPLAKGLIAKLTNKVLQQAGSELEATDDDVQTGGEEVLVEDTDDSSTTEETGIPTPPTPPPTPEPTPTPTGDGPDYDPTVNLPDPNAPEIDWWPDLPTIEVDLGNPACPTYQLTLAGWWTEPFVLDSHCPLIEQNRAAISLLMIAMFSMMSMFIVLRA